MGNFASHGDDEHETDTGQRGSMPQPIRPVRPAPVLRRRRSLGDKNIQRLVSKRVIENKVYAQEASAGRARKHHQQMMEDKRASAQQRLKVRLAARAKKTAEEDILPSQEESE